MGKALQSLLIVSFILVGPLCFSQTSVKVSDPRLEIRDNLVTITYDILNSSPEESFIIGIEIKDEAGQIINAKALEGDIGDEVSGGSNKKIFWNLEADNIYLDAYIVVKITAKATAPPVKAIAKAQEDTLKIATIDIVEEPTKAVASKSFSRTGIIFQSIAFPGLGLSRMTGKPHWLRGVAGYGCIVGSIVLNRQAINTYNQINDLDYYDEISAAYNKSLQQDNFSEVLAYAAAGIWVADLIWTVVGTSDMHKNVLNMESRGFSIESSFDPLANVPMVSVRYRF